MQERLNLCRLMLNRLGSHKEFLDKEFVRFIEILKKFQLEYSYFGKEFLYRWWSFINQRYTVLHNDKFVIIPWHSVYFLNKCVHWFHNTFSEKMFCLKFLVKKMLWNWWICSELQMVNFKDLWKPEKWVFLIGKKFRIMEQRIILSRGALKIVWFVNYLASRLTYWISRLLF